VSFGAKRSAAQRPFAKFARDFQMFAAAVLVAALCPQPAVAQMASRSICIGSCVDSGDIKNNSVTGADIKNNSVTGADIKNNSVAGADIKNNSITSTDIKNGQVKRADIADRAVDSAKIANITRAVSLPATGLSYQVGTNIITPSANGLRWKRNFSGNARLSILKPADYAGGDARVRIFFLTTTATAGAVDFFIRPDSFNAGNVFTEISPVGAPAVLVLGAGPPGTFGKFYEQAFPVPKERITKNWWTINIQRAGQESSYFDDVIVMSVALEYRAIQ
jgi:hypothetical protein